MKPQNQSHTQQEGLKNVEQQILIIPPKRQLIGQAKEM